MLDAFNDLTLSPSIFVIIGPNGAGKTTLLEEIVADRKDDCAFLPQVLTRNEIFDISISVFCKVFLGKKNTRIQQDYLNFILTEVRDFLKIDNILQSSFIRDLSMGEFKKLVFYLLLQAGKSILVLDEPTANLDLRAVDAFYYILQNLRDKFGISTVISSHDLHLVMKNADRVVCVNRGIHCVGSPKDIQDSEVYKSFAFRHLGVYLHRKE